MVEIGAFRVFMRTRLIKEPYSPLKPNKVGFIFIGSNSLGRAEAHKLSSELGRSLDFPDATCAGNFRMGYL